jgi:N-methylhydantoinase B/oxoprolinase/acetone carboxylase alpha subunit
MKRDPIELELFRNLFVSIAEEMGAVLRKTSYSANIKERRDYSCAIYDAAGETVAMGDHMPVHLGAMPLSVRHALDAFTLRPGDVAILNDPFRGGTHLPDITAISGVFLHGGKRASFYVASRAHHADVGGMSPGSMPMAREIYQEGIRIPPILLARGGRIDRDLLRLIVAMCARRRSVKATCGRSSWRMREATAGCARSRTSTVRRPCAATCASCRTIANA